MVLKYLIIISFIIFYQDNICSQVITDTIKTPTKVVIDSTQSVEKQPSKIKSFFNIFKGKPGRAALLSLIIPGGGQVYNRKYWKAPIVWGIDGYYIYQTIVYANYYSEFDLANTRMINGEISNWKGFNQAQTLSLRNRARLLKEKHAVYLGIAHLLSVIDAFVDRHLMDFDMNEDLTFDVNMEKLGSKAVPIDYVGYQMTYRF